MESQPQNPEFRNNPENFHPCRKNEWEFFFGLMVLEIKDPSHEIQKAPINAYAYTSSHFQ